MADYPDLPLKALSIMQPWAWLIVTGQKDIENRDWPTSYRGPVAIHAGKKIDRLAELELVDRCHPVTGRPAVFGWHGIGDGMLGGIVGIAHIVDCIPHADADLQDTCSEWFVGKHGFVLRNARPVPFIPVKGALGFFDWRRNIIAPVGAEGGAA